MGSLKVPGIEAPLSITAEDFASIGAKYLRAAQDAGAIYRHIVAAKGEDSFVAEVSMDETDLPQTPRELLLILAALADQKIRVQTIAPKFTGRFNKGVDYVGDLAKFEQEFSDDLAVLRFAIERFALPENLKLSIHSGSDKFSLYPIVHRCLKEKGVGIHIKTAGTTWLEELIGLSEAGGDGLAWPRRFMDMPLSISMSCVGPTPASSISIGLNSLRSQKFRNGMAPNWQLNSPHPQSSRFQRVDSTTATRFLQVGGKSGRTLSRPLETASNHRGSASCRKPIRPTYAATVPRKLT